MVGPGRGGNRERNWSRLEGTGDGQASRRGCGGRETGCIRQAGDDVYDRMFRSLTMSWEKINISLNVKRQSSYETVLLRRRLGGRCNGDYRWLTADEWLCSMAWQDYKLMSVFYSGAGGETGSWGDKYWTESGEWIYWVEGRRWEGRIRGKVVK